MTFVQGKTSRAHSSAQPETTHFAECSGELFRDVATALERAGHKLCVLHGYTSFPERVDSDVDATSLDPTHIPHILSKCCSTDSFNIVQVVQHAASTFCYVLYRSCEGRPVFLSLDVYSDYRKNGCIFFGSEEFLESSRPFKFFNVPSPDLEFTCYLIRKIIKGSLDEAQARRLTQVYSENPVGCEQQLVPFFPPEEIGLITQAAQSGDWGPVRSRITSLRQSMLNKVRREHPLQMLRYWIDDLHRRAKRIYQPTGLMVAFLGPDGSGKSTVINRIEQKLAPVFWETVRHHLRPRAILGRTETDGPATDPHAELPRGKIASLAKLGLWTVDYTLGYLIRIFPCLVRRSTLVLFDRYYHDLLVDTRRHRYGGRLWPVRFVGWFIPRPHLIFLLDVPPRVLQTRKREVSFEEASRQREEYLKLVRNLPNGHIVDSSKPLDEVVAEVEEVILEHMVGRTAHRLKLEEKR